MASFGAIFLHRKIWKNAFWNDKPFAMGQAWIDLLLLANHKDAEVLHQKSVLKIKRGQLVRSEQELADRWGWSKSKVHRFLKTCAKCSMIVSKPEPKANRITILNYDQYQKLRTESEPIVNRSRTDREPKQECYKNVKNVSFFRGGKSSVAERNKKAGDDFERMMNEREKYENL